MVDAACLALSLWKRRSLSMSFRVLVCGWIALTSAGLAAAQSQRPEDLARGKMLVAPRETRDPLFAQTVVLLVRYDASGAVGLVLNRPTDIPISRALRGIPGSAKHTDTVYVGGPVELDTVMAVARSAHKPEGAEEVFGGIYLVAAKSALEKALGEPANPGGLRVYLGYCGWGPRQLDNEMRLKGWYVFDRSESLAFDTAPATLWSRLVGRTETQIVQLLRFAEPYAYAQRTRSRLY
ncbi:MAG TPA: YqgE/AlgH family protein [Bryobacteraceae bacterium]|nr:YqgE/AlgH family protein [Bryobacteraceae bacterium]